MISVQSGAGARRAGLKCLAAAAAALLAIGPAVEASAATQFKPDATAVWVARTKAMSQVFQTNITQGAATDAEKYANKDALVANLATACDGVNGEQVKNEYGKVPKWALASQLEICGGFERWAGKSFMTSKEPCRSMTEGLKWLAQAKAGEDPPEVIEAVNALVPVVQSLLDAAKSKNEHLNLRCKY